MSLSDSVIEGLGRLRVTQGEGEGRPLTVFPWQRRFIRARCRTVSRKRR